MGGKRALRRLIGLTVGVCAAVLAVPAVASESDVSIGQFKFAPATVTVQQGDTVTWSWAGPDINHTVTTDPGQADSLESDPGVATNQITGPPPGGTYSHTFNTPGTFTYFCRVHTSMKAKVVVTPAPAPPAPPSDQGTAPAAPQGAAGSGHPTFKECLSQRNFIIRLRELGGVHLKSATVVVNGKPAAVVARTIGGRRRLTARVDLRGLASGQYVVKIEAKTTEGRILRGKRLYATCSKKVPSYILPKL
jgi:plastocyanin